MNEAEYHDCLDELYESIEDAVDACDEDIDCIIGGGVMTLKHATGGSLILSRQAATRQLWLAAKSGGFHFALQEGEWLNTRSGEPFSERFADCSREQFGSVLDIG